MDEIVIAGISGRLPESNNLEEFWENLINGVDMVTEDDRRWTPGERPHRLHETQLVSGEGFPLVAGR